MRSFVAILLVVAAVYAHEEVEIEKNDTCPAFGDWLPWSDQCLWFPLSKMRSDIADACQTTFNITKHGSVVPTPPGFTIPDRCGHCSFKFRCRKREKVEGCLSIEAEKKSCEEHSEVCTLPPSPHVGCKWNVFAAGLKACLNRADLPDWRREAYRKFADGMPEANCIQKGDQCKCCCHPFRPSEDGLTCVKEPEPECPAFNNFNNWSTCLWYPFASMMKNIQDHCELDAKETPEAVIPTPAGLQIPEKCGFCSFQMRCRKREKKEGCFYLDAEKKACGPNDCPTCGDACTMKKLNGTCNWGNFVASNLHAKLESMMTDKQPYWRKRGIKNLMQHIPYGTCKSIGETCKCCCHPYEPNEDGTACVLTQMCAMEPTH
jgi:hypothetical protein